jgi:hypothetical protein
VLIKADHRNLVQKELKNASPLEMLPELWGRFWEEKTKRRGHLEGMKSAYRKTVTKIARPLQERSRENVQMAYN